MYIVALSILIDRYGLMQPGTLIVRNTTWIARHMLGRWPSSWDEAKDAYDRFWGQDMTGELEPYWDRVEYTPIDDSRCVVRVSGRNAFWWPTELVETLDYTPERERDLAREEASHAEGRSGRS